MHDSLNYTTAFIVGLLSGAHCMGMCGGIMNALSFVIPEQQRSIQKVTPILLFYNIGRISSYAIAGAIVGLLGGWLQTTGSQVGPTLRIIAGLMLITMGLYLAGWWRGLTYLEKAGGALWKYLQPIGNRLMPVTRPRQALMLGMLWGWLPCGLVYSTLTWSATASNWQQSALVMLSFGLGTIPVMLLTGVFAHQVKAWIQKTTVRNVAALLIISFGAWTMGWTIAHLDHKHTSHSSTNPTVMDRDAQ